MPPLAPLWGTWEGAETAPGGPASPLGPADEESGRVTSGTIAVGGMIPGAMGGVGRANNPDPLLEDPAGVDTWYVPVPCVGEVYSSWG
jgi:hypothetical protein